MTTPMLELPNRIVPTGDDTRIAKQSQTRLARYLGHSLRVRLLVEGDSADGIDVPPAMIPLLSQILSELSEGHAVSIVADDADLTLEQAARVLNCSEDLVNRLLDDGSLRCIVVGGERRIKFVDALHERQRVRQERLKIMDELTADAQSMKWGY